MSNGPKLLADWIERAKLSKGEAASRIGISRPFMSHILGGHRRPTLPNAVKIEEVTGIPVASWVPLRRGKSGKARKGSVNSPVLA